jgi:hypothetical protein
MDYYQALELAKEFTVATRADSMIGGLQYLAFKDVLGSSDKHWRSTRKEFDGALYWKKGTERVDEYISKVLSC